MRALIKNSSLRNSNRYQYSKSSKDLLVLVAFLLFFGTKAQIANYVNNPSFEVTVPTISISIFNAAKFWGPIDTSNGSHVLFSTILGSAPYCSTGFQFPKSGNNFIGTSFFCDACPRWNPRNRLKQPLKPNITYCAKYHVVNTNNNRIAIENYSMYFGNYLLDTITNCTIPLTYLNPQVEYTNGIITDTLNWTPISGTFVATGGEKYMVLGNFKSNATTNTLLINSPLQPMSNDVYIDDVSLIEMDLPAFAGRDTFFIPGSSLFIGRQPDVGLDEHCMWYKLPNMTTAIDTVAGLWVTPVGTTTYVVRQQLWCSGVKWDTVVVYESAVGIPEAGSKSQDLRELRLYPVPAKDQVEIQMPGPLTEDEYQVIIYNTLGQMVREEELSCKEGKAILSTIDLPNGAYLIALSNDHESITKKLLIAK